MTRLTARSAAILACTAALLLLVPGLANASYPRGGTGGSGLGGSGGTGSSGSTGSGNGGSGITTTTTTTTTTTPVATTLQLGTLVWATGDGLTVGATGSLLKGQTVTFTGSAPLSDAGQEILIRYASVKAAGGWVAATDADISSTGTFNTVWTATASGELSFTAVLAPAGAIPASNPVSAAFSVQVFKSAVATIYGPGLWGHRTACGQRLRRATLGVANRTLKCGTKVAVYYGGRELVVPVIDRGPFANHASWDLTLATARALGVTHTATVGTIAPWSQSPQPSARS